MRIRTIKSLTTFMLLVLCGLMPSFAQEYKYNIYVYYKGTIDGSVEFFIENDKGLITTINNSRSYIVLKSNSDDLFLRTRWGYAGTYEKIKTKKYWRDYTKKLSHSINDYYLEVTASPALVNATKADFDKKIAKLTFQGEYVLDDNSQPAIAQQPAQQQYYQQPVQQPVIQQPVQQTQVAATTGIQSDVDVNIPKTERKASDTFVLIIANEHYTFVDNVDFAIHDGEIFKEYCINTLGVPERQVWFYKDASAGIISGGVDKMVQAMSLFENSKAIVYYCGHGIPDEHTGDAYIVPTDGKGTNTATCYSLNKMYTTLATSNAVSVTYFMDACFSGANKEGSMLVAARGVAREPKKETLSGNTVVFSAASGDETAMTFKEKGHGLFTYFLLKKLQETSGDVSYGDLDKYIKDNVKKESFLTNDKIQTPTTNVSENAVDTWKQMKLK